MTKPTTEARRHGEVKGENERFGPDCVQPTRQVSGPDFSRAEKNKEIWASAPAVFRRLIQTLRAVLREIFDESAYDRFLLRTHAMRTRCRDGKEAEVLLSLNKMPGSSPGIKSKTKLPDQLRRSTLLLQEPEV
jgi:hypothetical protein